MTEFYETSSALLNSKRGGEGFKPKYPWREVPLGKSFIVQDKNSITLSSLRTLAFRTGKQLRKKFKVFEHDDCYEVGRLPDPEVKPKSNPSDEQPSNEASLSTWEKMKVEGKV